MTALRRRKVTGRGACCRHPEIYRAELLLASGASVHSVARKFKLNYYALHRHWHHHIDESRRASLALGPVERMSLAARVAEEAESVIDHHRVVRAGLYELYNATVEAGDGTTGALLAGKLTDLNIAIAKITGQLAQSPLVQVNHTNVFINDPAFASFQADLIRVLSRFPDARDAVIAEFERLETNPAQRPALEHQAHG